MVRKLSIRQRIARQIEAFNIEREFRDYEHNLIDDTSRDSPTAFDTAEKYYSQHPDMYESKKLNEIEVLTRRQRTHIRAHLALLTPFG